MVPTMKIVTVFVLASLMVVSVQGNPPPPAIGDILLVPYDSEPELLDFYEVLIYYSDGESKADYGGVCANNSFHEEAIVICHQLGYQYSHFGLRSTNSPVWFKNIQCDDINTPHILRCHTNATSSGERNSSTVCGPNNYRLLVNCDFTKPLDPYDGQVALCPVDLTNGNKNISSTSFGLVGIYYENNDYGSWKGINQKDGKFLGAYEGDTICRQMGFTGAYPGTAVTRNVDNYNFSNCFSNTGTRPPFRFHHGAWTTTSDITCQEQQNCIGCCLQYTGGACIAPCDEMHNLVIRCAFDPTKTKLNQGTAGSEESCKLDSNKNVGHCDSGFITDNSQEVTHWKIAFGIVAGLLVLLGPCGCCCLCCIYKKYLHNRCRERFNAHRRHIVPAICCRDYEPIEQPVENNNQNAQINQNQNQNANT